MVSITIIFGRVPGQVHRVSVESGTTVRQLLSTEGISLRPSDSIFVQGRIAQDEDVLHDGDIVLIVALIVGRATVRRKGIWRVYKYDADDVFPSDFHAHNMDAAEVLDLHTGDVYDARTRKYLRKLAKSDLAFIKNHL